MFGKDFGDLLTPASPTCYDYWKTLPGGQFFIAVSVADIEQIMEVQGDPKSQTQLLNLEPPVSWFNLSGLPEACGCESGGEYRYSFVQTAWLSIDRNVVGEAGTKHDFDSNFDFEKYARGAIVFGYNAASEYYLSQVGSALSMPNSSVKDIASEQYSNGRPPRAALTQPVQSHSPGSIDACKSHYASTSAYGNASIHQGDVDTYYTFGSGVPVPENTFAAQRTARNLPSTLNLILSVGSPEINGQDDVVQDAAEHSLSADNDAQQQKKRRVSVFTAREQPSRKVKCTRKRVMKLGKSGEISYAARTE